MRECRHDVEVYTRRKNKSGMQDSDQEVGRHPEMRIGALQRLVDAAIHRRENAEGEDF